MSINQYSVSGSLSAVPLSYEQVSAWKWSDSESIRLVPARYWHQWGTIMSNPFHEFSININQWHLSKNYIYMYDIYKHIYIYICLGASNWKFPCSATMPGCRSGTGQMLRAWDWFLPGTRILQCIDGYYHVLRSTMWNLSDIHCIYITDLAIHIYSLGLVNGGLPALPLWAGAVLELTRLCFCQTGSCLALACYGAVTKCCLLCCYCILVL